MVGTETPALQKAQTGVDELDKRLGERRAAPIEPAMRARAECLAALTAARRPAGTTSSIGKSDQLLSEISAMGGLLPMRDDRGVVVTLRELFAASQLTKEARERLAALGRVAQAHADFPVQVVVHGASDRQQGDAVAKALVEAGANRERLLVEAAGSAHPLLDAGLARDPKRNERIEVIFVDPGG
jgi:hypothetical protein